MADEVDDNGRLRADDANDCDANDGEANEETRLVAAPAQPKIVAGSSSKSPPDDDESAADRPPRPVYVIGPAHRAEPFLRGLKLSGSAQSLVLQSRR
ncbi:unnamed protein product, partial [Nesidiocoris tenuis]